MTPQTATLAILLGILIIFFLGMLFGRWLFVKEMLQSATVISKPNDTIRKEYQVRFRVSMGEFESFID